MAGQAVVRLRWQRGVFTSDLVDVADAEQRAQEIRQAVVHCRDGVGFVGFAARGGHLVQMRGREVVAVEVLPEAHLREPTPPRTDPVAAGTVAAGSGVTVSGVTVSGTGFLREQAATQASGR